MQQKETLKLVVKDEMSKMENFYIGRAEEAFHKLSNAYKKILSFLPDKCSKYLEKIHQLETENQLLNEKIENLEKIKLFEYKTKLDDARFKLADSNYWKFRKNGGKHNMRSSNTKSKIYMILLEQK